jgi:hypothetical protein
MKKSQAAMEFLMTYGWAIFIILVAIGALAYFGVLDPIKMLPEKCTGDTGFTCTDRPGITGAVTGAPIGGTIKFVFTNNQGKDVIIYNSDAGNGARVPTLAAETGTCTPSSIEFSDSACTTDASTTPSCTYKNDAMITAIITCSSGEPAGAGRFKGILTVTTVNPESGLEHKADFSLIGSIS